MHEGPREPGWVDLVARDMKYRHGLQPPTAGYLLSIVACGSHSKIFNCPALPTDWCARLRDNFHNDSSRPAGALPDEMDHRLPNYLACVHAPASLGRESIEAAILPRRFVLHHCFCKFCDTLVTTLFYQSSQYYLRLI
jgi:hypothetical protein